MQDFPDFNSPLHDESNRARKINSRSGSEPIPEFDRTATVTLEIEVLKETYDEILNAIVGNEWEREEGLRTVLLSGLGHLDANLNLDRTNRQATQTGEDGTGASKRMDLMNKELAAYHSMYSVMKFKAYKLFKANQTLELKVAGLRETERVWGVWAEHMRREHASLQIECIRLRALMSEFKLDWDHAPTDNADADFAAQIEQPAITTPLLTRILPDFLDEPVLELPVELPLSKPSLWERFKALLHG